jgi:hypothetical protein
LGPVMLGMNKRAKKRRKNVRRREDIKDGNHYAYFYFPLLTTIFH